MTTMTHTHIHTHTHTPINRLWSPLAYGLGGNNVSFILNPSLPLETNRNRKRGFNVPLRKESAYFPEHGKKKLCAQELLGNSRPLKKAIYKIKNDAEEERKSQEEEIISRQSQNNGVKYDPNMFEKGFSNQLAARSSANRFAAGLANSKRRARCLRAAHLIFCF